MTKTEERPDEDGTEAVTKTASETATKRQEDCAEDRDAAETETATKTGQ